MNKRRLLPIGAAWIGAFFLIVMVALAFQVQGVKSQGAGDDVLENDKARAAEATGHIERNIQVNPENNGSGGNFPLFVGVDDTTVWAERIDVTNNAFLTAFLGVEVWGAAYDPVNDIVYVNDGSSLYEWPVGSGTPTLVGTIVDGGGAAQTMVSLAFYNGSLYSTRNIANEAVYEIDLNTLVATVVIDYVDGDYDFGGLGVDPNTGIFYGTNDDTTPFGSGLFQINNDGTATLIAAYPAGANNDVDGLTVGTDGRAYMVTDDANGPIFVYNLNTNSFDPQLVNPFPSSEIFAGAAWIEQTVVDGPSISLNKTVGTDVNSCAGTDSIVVNYGTQVTYCYEVTNNGTFTLYYHDLVDSELGTILLGDFQVLGPGSSTFVTETAFIQNTTINTATWTSCDQTINFGGEAGFDCGSIFAINVVSDTDTATVVVPPPSIDLVKTVGTDPNTCAATDSIVVAQGTQVTYCYEVTNDGGTTFFWHDLFDSELGTILSGFPYQLDPGASVFVTDTAFIFNTTVNTATWTACNQTINATGGFDCTSPFAVDVVSDTDTALVTVPPPSIDLVKTVGTDPNVCAATDSITVAPGTDVTYCFEVTNDGLETLTVHELSDSELGTILTGFPFTLTSGSSVFVTATTNIVTDTTNTATWTACNIDGPPSLTCFDTAAFDVVSDTDTANVMVVGTPDIEVDPNSMEETLYPNMMSSQPLTISNIGDATLNWTLVEQAPVTTGPVAPPTAVEIEVVSSPADCAQYENYAGIEPVGYAEHCVDAVLDPWVSDDFDPTDTAFALDIGFVSDNFISHVLNNFPGQTVLGPNAQPIFAMDFDPTGTTLFAIDNTSRQLGTINLTNGSFTNIAAVTGIPGGDTISGLTIDPVSGVAYVSSITPGVSYSLYSINLGTAVATLIGTDASTQLMIDIAIGPQGIMYGHDIGTDLIYTINTSNGTVTSVGATGVNSNFAQGMDFDNVDGTLYAYTYQGGGANVYGTIDLGTGALTPLATNNPQGEFEGAVQNTVGGCEASDISWLDVNPTSGSAAPGGSNPLTVDFDSTGLVPGVYTGTLCVASNDPVDPVVTVPITLNVLPYAPNLVLTKTVGLDNGTCAATDNLAVPPNTDVYYCYTVQNTGDVTFTVHDLVDDQLGTLFSGFPQDLAPGATFSFFPVTATITGNVTNIATWTAYVDTATFVTATDSATVTMVPTAVSLSSFGGNSNMILLPMMLGVLAFLVLAAGFFIRRMNSITSEA